MPQPPSIRNRALVRGLPRDPESCHNPEMDWTNSRKLEEYNTKQSNLAAGRMIILTKNSGNYNENGSKRLGFFILSLGGGAQWLI
jgi:hypothetical protein